MTRGQALDLKPLASSRSYRSGCDHVHIRALEVPAGSRLASATRCVASIFLLEALHCGVLVKEELT